MQDMANRAAGVHCRIAAVAPGESRLSPPCGANRREMSGAAGMAVELGDAGQWPLSSGREAAIKAGWIRCSSG